MIAFKDNVFRLNTQNTSYIFSITSFKHIEHIYYGTKLKEQSLDALKLKRSATIGTSVIYDESDDLYCLDNMCLEWSGIGKGDYRHSPTEIKMPDGSYTSDFIYQSHTIEKGHTTMNILPSSYGEKEDCDTLKITLKDLSNNVMLIMIYTVYNQTDVITRRVVIENHHDKSLDIRRLMSMMIDLPNKNYHMLSLDGGWIKETNLHQRKIEYGMYVNSSTTGASSNRHNPGFLLAESNTTENTGNVYGFNIIYSGNHYGAVELSNHDLVRVQLGINPHCFSWILQKDEKFETPEVIMTFSDSGYNELSHHFHDFINDHIIRGDWKNKERPVLLNNWEACFFKYTQGKLMRLARKAKSLGVELFVLDDGWFSNRDDDTRGLGDYSINKKKLPKGLTHFIKKINKLGLSFGLWFEPEMVNKDSDLYRAHPEYAVSIPGKKESLGRNQLVLDLCNKEVRDYIVTSISKILDESNITYVKWDMNRHISDAYSSSLSNQGEFYHSYILGLYDILKRIFIPRPHILLESCSSGGNRFDVGMLCYSPQVWASDDTDPIERLKIQSGLSYLYPPSTMGAHVSSAPHQQTLRNTPLSTRFNVSSFGCLGYELDLKYLSYVEKREIKKQIAFYKQHRKMLQYGDFYRSNQVKANKVHFQSVSKDKTKSIAGLFQTLSIASEGQDILPLHGLDKDSDYTLSTREQPLFIGQFGELVKHIIPVSLHPEGLILRTANKYYKMNNCVEQYEGDGNLLMQGIRLNNQFMGSYYNQNTRLLSDYGSNLYIINKKIG